MLSHLMEFIEGWILLHVIEIFLSVYNEFLLINNDLSRRCGQKGGSDYGDVSPVPLESHDPWAKSLHSIMNEHKMIEMKV